jgi:DamX protein
MTDASPRTDAAAAADADAAANSGATANTEGAANAEVKAGVAAPAPGTLQLATAQPNPFVGMSRRYYDVGDRGRHLEDLRLLARWPRRVLAVTGERGIGKSTLFRALSGRLDTGVKAARINANLTSDVREVLGSVLNGLGVAAPAGANAKALIDRLASHVEAQAETRRQCVVLVDDAHLLELRALDQLLRLVDATSADALRIVFFAEPPFVRMLAKACARSTAAQAWHEIRLSPLGEADVRRYVALRLQDGGARGPAPFKSAALDLIAKRSGGVPGRVNEVAAALVDGTLRVVDSGRWLPTLHRALAWWLCAAVFSTWLVLTTEFGGRKAPAADAEEVGGPTTLADDTGESEPLVGGAVSTIALPPVSSEVSAVESEPAAPPAPGSVPADPAASPEVALERTPPPAPARATSEPREAEAPPARRVPVPSTGRASPTSVAPVAREHVGAGGAEWFFDQPRTRYTLQLFGTSSREQWQRYVRAHDDAALAAFETVRNGKPWFVVTYGSFASQEHAEAAAARLPKSLGPVQPWVRTFGAIQESIGR